MSQKFKVGDVVYHKSNLNFQMVILYCRELGETFPRPYTCAWISKKGKFHEHNFKEEELELYNYIKI